MGLFAISAKIFEIMVWLGVFTVCAVVVLILLDAFDCYYSNKDEYFDTTSVFEYLRTYFREGIWRRDDDAEPPEKDPGNRRSKSDMSESHQRELEKSAVEALTMMATINGDCGGNKKDN